jgi:hypothetical protein
VFFLCSCPYYNLEEIINPRKAAINNFSFSLCPLRSGYPYSNPETGSSVLFSFSAVLADVF